MPNKDCCLPINAKFVSNGEIFFDELPEVVTCYQWCHPARKHDTSDSWGSTVNKLTEWLLSFQRVTRNGTHCLNQLPMDL